MFLNAMSCCLVNRIYAIAILHAVTGEPKGWPSRAGIKEIMQNTK